jgi:VIT1/CCC1 family predicted Fe2+/Mn2+ transporter
MAHDALGAHARDELGMSSVHRARPLQAALASAVSFSAGAVLPLLVILLAPARELTIVLACSTLLFLGVLGGIAARIGGAPILAAMLRVTLWGALAMALTALVGGAFVSFA